jgi:hypothetical protein
MCVPNPPPGPQPCPYGQRKDDHGQCVPNVPPCKDESYAKHNNECQPQPPKKCDDKSYSKSHDNESDCPAPNPKPCDDKSKWDDHAQMCVPNPPPGPQPCPYGQRKDDHGQCVPNVPPCPQDMHRDDHGQCVPNVPPAPSPQPTCPAGTTPTTENGQMVCVKVVVVPGPTQVVVTPCPACCPPAASTPAPQQGIGTPVVVEHKAKCPKVKKSQIKISFTPKHLKHGNLNVNIKVPPSWHVNKVALAICTPKSGLGGAKSCVASKTTKVKLFVIKLNHGTGHLVLPLWRTDIWGHWLFGHHRMQFTLKLPCGLKVVVRKPYFNLDPQPGVVPPLLK